MRFESRKFVILNVFVFGACPGHCRVQTISQILQKKEERKLEGEKKGEKREKTGKLVRLGTVVS